jgi:hypothetical protein
MNLPREMLRISRGQDRAGALRARAQSEAFVGCRLRSTVATARQSRAYFDAPIADGKT